MNKAIKIIEDLIKACSTLMDEVCQKEATNWGIVNDALIAGEKYLKINRPQKTGIKIKNK